MTSRQSKTNNISRPLSGDPSGNTFTGQWESSAGALVLGAFVASPTLALVTIEQSVNRGVTIQLTDTFNIGLTQIDKMNVFRVPCGFAWFRVRIENFEGNQTYLSLNTYLESSYIEPTTTVSIGGVVDVSGSVVASNLITETLATRRVDFLVVGDYYRVASVGLTSGAQWNAIGAIVDGESVPVIGRLFKCLAIGPAVAGGGECYDVEYTDEVSATITNFPAYPTTIAVTGTVGLTDPTTVRVRDSYGDVITTTAGNLMVGINNIYTANPLHTILDSGTVGLSTSANTIKIDQTSVATNGVRTIAPDTSSVRVTTAGSTGVEVNQGGHLLSFLAVNLSATADAYVKLYDSVAAPIPASDVPFMIAHVSRDATSRLPSLQVDTSNLKVTSKLWVRAVTGSADTNTDVTGLSMDITFFVTAT